MSPSSSWETHLRATQRHLPYVYTELPATQHGWTRAVITPARQTDTRFNCPGEMKDWVVDLGVGYTIYLSAESQSPIQVLTTWQRPDWELNLQPRNRESNVLTITLPTEVKRLTQKLLH